MINVDPHMTRLSPKALGPGSDSLRISENFTANSSNFATPHLADDEAANFGKASREAPWQLCDSNIILSIHLYLADSFDRKPSSDCLFGFFVESSRDFE